MNSHELEEIFIIRERYRDKEEYRALVVCYSDGCRTILERDATEEEIEKFLEQSDGCYSIIIGPDS